MRRNGCFVSRAQAEVSGSFKPIRLFALGDVCGHDERGFTETISLSCSRRPPAVGPDDYGRSWPSVTGTWRLALFSFVAEVSMESA
jgi:hypothetical protein